MQTIIVCEEIGELLEQLGLARQEKGFERLSYAIAVTLTGVPPQIAGLFML